MKTKPMTEPNPCSLLDQTEHACVQCTEFQARCVALQAELAAYSVRIDAHFAELDKLIQQVQQALAAVNEVEDYDVIDADADTKTDADAATDAAARMSRAARSLPHFCK
jgi:hypothetical protein